MDPILKKKVDTSHNQASEFLQAEKYKEAESLYREILAEVPDDIVAHNNIGLAFLGQQKYNAAVEIFQQAISLNQNLAPLHHNIGLGLYKLGRVGEAVLSFRSALSLDPTYKEALQNLGAALKETGNIEEAASCYRRLLELMPNDSNARYMLDSLTGVNRQEAAPQEYVAKLFDDYADRFEDQLVQKLQYHIPGKLKHGFVSFLQNPQARFANVLDLGCGTGLTAKEFRPLADRMIGVDLSKKMLEKAQAKGLYDVLHQTDITEFLKNAADKYDLVVAADVFIYVGKLDNIFKLLAEKIITKGYFLFSTEENPDTSDFSLLSTGRYAHSPMYIQFLAHKNNFLVRLCQPTDVRKEGKTWLRGSIYILQSS